jgi:hypothetical protein
MVTPSPGPAPGGDFFDNASMVAYLLGSEDLGAKDGYYLLQTKDDGKGFSRGSLEQTTEQLIELAQRHRCTSIIGLDFGGDVALSAKKKDGGPFIQERDRLNFKAAKAAATKLGLEANMVAVAPGIDGAGVAPTYNEVRGLQMARQRSSSSSSRRLSDSFLSVNSGRTQGGHEKRSSVHKPTTEDGFKDTPSFEMNGDGKLLPLDAPAPVCSLPTLPKELFKLRLMDVEEAFMRELRMIATNIIKDTPDAKRKEHASKTYHMLSCIGGLAEKDKEFFALGRFRSSEHARAHMHSSYAMGVYSLRDLEEDY